MLDRIEGASSGLRCMVSMSMEDEYDVKYALIDSFYEPQDTQNHPK